MKKSQLQTQNNKNALFFMTTRQFLISFALLKQFELRAFISLQFAKHE